MQNEIFTVKRKRNMKKTTIKKTDKGWNYNPKNKNNHSSIEKEMKNIAKGIFSYNPKTDPNDPLFEESDKKKIQE